ncbi:TraR/DksA C4-type zinc finger protein [Citrobacter koseri]|uniref:TraR/DksA C4-type zinc finger protein n=1 Tax=Citrobacter koseri TaxID=545 RepID=UPI00389A46C1
MADIVDEALQSTELFLYNAVAQAKSTNAVRMVTELYCCDCGEEIPRRRLQLLAGVTTCTDCQSRKELSERINKTYSMYGDSDGE